MKIKTWIPIALAMVLGLSALFVTKNMLGRNDKPEVVSATTTRIVVAKRDIAPGHVITAEDLAMTGASDEMTPDGVFFNSSELLGRVTAVALVRGQTVLAPMLAPEGSGSGLAALVPDGMRAITIEVNEFSGLAGLLRPGSRVDIISLLRDDNRGETVSRTIVQNVKVTAVGQQTSPNPSNPNEGIPNSVTLMTTPEEAQKLQLASQGGRPWLVLRNMRDQLQLELAGTRQSDLRGDNNVVDPFAPTVVPVHIEESPVEVKPAEPVAEVPQPVRPTVRHRTVKLIRGGQESNVVFEIHGRPSQQMLTGGQYELE